MNIARSSGGIVTVGLLLVIVSVAAGQYSGGKGTAENPYKIATAADLIALGETFEDYGQHFILTADINLDPKVPGGKAFDAAVIAPEVDPDSDWPSGIEFEGTFDGRGHIIRGLTITGGQHLGLFGYLSFSATVLNLGLEDLDVVGGDYVGGLAGSNGGTVFNCYSTGSVRGNDYVGGLAGYSPGTILDSHNKGVIKGEDYVGGLAGYSFYAILNCSNRDSVEGATYVGGLVGNNYGTVSNCYNAGSVEGVSFAGGLVGTNHFRVISNSYNTGNVTGTSYIGGLVGAGAGAVSNTYSTGRVIGTSAYAVGGLVGGGGTILRSFWDTTTSGIKSNGSSSGLATLKLQDINTFLDAGWDFLGEQGNGVCETWVMPVGGGYPKLSTLYGYIPPTPAGSGTPDDPYIVKTPQDLGVVGHRPTASYRLDSDISLSQMIWSTAIVPAFLGSFDGQGHAIRNMAIDGDGYLGLFATLGASAAISGLRLENVKIVYTGGYVGSLACWTNFAKISDCHSAGSISHSTGTSSVKMTGWYVGGLVGYNTGATVSNSSSTCSITGDVWCYESGGLVGSNQGTISRCFSTGPISGGWHVGGLVGRNNVGTILNCYSTGSARAVYDYVGGLVGENNSLSITNSYSTGSARGRNYVGGLVGKNNRTVTGCFWDTTTSGQATSAAGSGLPTTAMHTINTYLNAVWDMKDIWTICEGQDYPRLRWEGRSCP